MVKSRLGRPFRLDRKREKEFACFRRKDLAAY
jgi:hypothetical protein